MSMHFKKTQNVNNPNLHFYLLDHENTGPWSRQPSQQKRLPESFVSTERTWWPVSQLHWTSGFCREAEDYCRSMWKPVWRGLMWLICMWKTRGLHTHSIQGFDPLKWMDPHTSTSTHTQTKSNNKQEEREGKEWRRPKHLRKTKNKDLIFLELNNV